MTHTWADVAYSFVNGTGIKGDLSPLELVVTIGSIVVGLCISMRYL